MNQLSHLNQFDRFVLNISIWIAQVQFKSIQPTQIYSNNSNRCFDLSIQVDFFIELKIDSPCSESHRYQHILRISKRICSSKKYKICFSRRYQENLCNQSKLCKSNFKKCIILTNCYVIIKSTLIKLRIDICNKLKNINQNQLKGPSFKSASIHTSNGR